MPALPLVGRTEELATLRRLLDDARAGHGALVLVSGEAGLGKSRLLTELADRARAEGIRVLTGAATEDAPAYRPVAQALLPVLRAQDAARSPDLRPYRPALGRLLPDWAEATDGRVDIDPALVLGEGVVRLLDGTARDDACLLLVEDAHWADPDTVALLEYLAGAMGDTRVLVVVSVRDDAAGADVVRRLGSSAGATMLPLSGLSPAEIEELATARAGSPLTPELAAYVVSHADGLPLLAEELAAREAAPTESSTLLVPSGFAAEVRHRLDSLTPAARSSLQAASTLGTEPDWTLLPQVTGGDQEAAWGDLREAVANHLLVQDPAGLRWRHALTREAVAASLLAPERAALARRSADILLERGRPEDEEHAARLLLQADESDAALEVLLRAAVRERRRAAYGSADRLLALAESAGGSTTLASERVLLLTLTGRPVAALEVGERALSAATGDEHAELCLRLARAAVDDRRWGRAEEYVERAGRPEDPRSRTLRADAAHGDGRVVEAAVLADRAVEMADGQATPDLLCEALVTQGRIARLSDLEAARRAFARAAQVAAEHGLAASRVEAMFGLGTLELLDDDESSTMREARELAFDQGLLSTALSAELLLCDHELLDAGPRSVRSRITVLVEQTGTLRLRGLYAMGGSLLALACACEGDLAAMDEALTGVATLPGLTPDLVAMTDAARAHAALLAHDLPTADALLDRGVPALVANPASAPMHVIGLWALLRTVSGSAGDGGRAARDAVRAIPAGHRLANRAAVGYADAVALGRSARPAEAADSFTAAEAMLRPSSWWRRVLRLLALERAVIDGWGTPIPELRANLAEHEAAGEEQLAGTCRDLLRRAGAPTRRGRGSGPVPPRLRSAGVTSRELDVLRLVRDGLANAEIAERLFLSVRTVETHVAHLLAKSGTSDRTELARWSREES